MLTIPLLKGSCHHRKQKMTSFGSHQDFLARISKSLYYVELPRGVVNCTSLPVTELASEIFSEINKTSLNRLDLEKAACLSRKACVSPCLLVVALLYLERLKLSNPKYLVKVSPTELFLILLMVSSKFVEDSGEGNGLSNTDWAELIGLSVQEINKAEKQFLDAINWDVYVSEEEFWERLHSLEMRVGLRQGCKRGWFTYTELNLLLQSIDLATVVQCFWNVTSASLLSYTPSVLTLLGSTLLVCQITGLGLKPKVPTADVALSSRCAVSSPEIFHPHSDGGGGGDGGGGIEECKLLFSLEQKKCLEGNETGRESLNPCVTTQWNNQPEKNLLNVFSWDLLFNEFHLWLSSGHSKEGKPFFLFNRFKLWSDYIRNYLTKIPSLEFFTQFKNFENQNTQKIFFFIVKKV